MQQSKNKYSFNQSISKFIKYLKPYYVWLVLAILFAVVGTICSIIGPNKIGEITNIIEENVMTNTAIDLASIAKIGILLVVLYGISAVFSYLQGYIMTAVV